MITCNSAFFLLCDIRYWTPTYTLIAANLHVKMAHLCAFTFLFLITFGTAQNNYTYYIKPTADTPCSVNPCYTLMEYLDQIEPCVAQSETIFLPGEHSLQQNFTISNCYSFVLAGNSSSMSRINCYDAGFVFENVSEVEIRDMNLASCGIEFIFTSAVVNNCMFLNSLADFGGAVFAQSSSVSFLWECEFVNNTAAVAGGGIFAEESNLTFQGNTTFTNNHAGKRGGGIYVTHSHVLFCGNVASFVANFVTELGWDTSPFGGGGIYSHSSNITFDSESSFISNSALAGGGICAWNSSSVTFTAENVFVNSSAVVGGGVVLGGSSTLKSSGDSSFIDGSALWGGGVAVLGNSTVHFDGDNQFANNSAAFAGGGIFDYIHNMTQLIGFADNLIAGITDGHTNREANNILNLFTNDLTGGWGGGIFVAGSTVSFDGENSFLNNSAEYDGGGIYAWYGSAVDFAGNNTFMHNMAQDDGGVLYVKYDSHLKFEGDSKFVNNTARDQGGAIRVRYNCAVIVDGRSNFIENFAEHEGGVICARGYSTITLIGESYFLRNSAFGGAGTFLEDNSMLTLGGRKSFYENSATYFGGCVAAKNSILQLSDSGFFVDNSARYGGSMYLMKSSLSISGNNTFAGNVATRNDGYGGAIHALSSRLTIRGEQEFTNNSAGYGGALALSGFDRSKIYLLPNTTMHFEMNVAHHRGGAIIVEDNPFTFCIFDSSVQSDFREDCFFQVLETNCGFKSRRQSLRDYGIHLRLVDNYASEAGSILYGGTLDSCAFCISSYEYVAGGIAFDRFANISGHENSTSDISSEPFRMCGCENDQPDCSHAIIPLQLFPGETFSIPVVAVGERDGPVPATVHAEVSEGIKIGELEGTQTTSSSCTNLQYTALAENIDRWNKANLSLYAAEPCSDFGFALQLSLTFLTCPDGFSLSTVEGNCVCDKRLQTFEVECDINDQSIEHNGDLWVGFDKTEGLILHPHCPLGYCKLEPVNFMLNSTDTQCNYNRSGRLCGTCQHGLSLALGSSQCLKCSNAFLALLFLFAIAGLALVLFLFTCKVTVADGTINGLVFYANILSFNQSIFFPSGGTNILTVFIAWLNLDFGIETCFFDGMDTYSKMWLQFAFPIYIWSLVGLITLLSNVSSGFARILGSTNPIAVLATLFLLSYTKLLQTIIDTFSFTTLEYPNHEEKVVWLYDGTVGYLDGKHITLFLVSLIFFLFLFLPYTLYLLFGQCIQARRGPRWLPQTMYLKLKLFLDAYHAPYRNNHRYWIGMLLLLRFILFIISATIDIGAAKDPHVNLLAISTAIVVVTGWCWNIHGVYKKWYLDALESSFFLNLIILCAATYQVQLAGGSQAAVVYTSVSIAFITFIVIIAYHMWFRAQDIRVWKNFINKVRNFCNQSFARKEPRSAVPELHTSCSDLREPLDLLSSYSLQQDS